MKLKIKDDDSLSKKEFNQLRKALKEVIAIKKGLSKPIPISQLWNN